MKTRSITRSPDVIQVNLWSWRDSAGNITAVLMHFIFEIFPLTASCETAYIGVCNDPNCQTVNYSYLPVTGEGVPCSACKKPVRGLNFHESIEPRSGFATEKEDKKVPRTKQVI